MLRSSVMIVFFAPGLWSCQEIPEKDVLALYDKEEYMAKNPEYDEKLKELSLFMGEEYIGNSLKAQANYLFMMKIRSKPFYIGPGLAINQIVNSGTKKSPDLSLGGRLFLPSNLANQRINVFYDFDWMLLTGIIRNTLGVGYSLYSWKLTEL